MPAPTRTSASPSASGSISATSSLTATTFTATASISPHGWRHWPSRGGICISRVVRDQIRDKLPYAFEDMGEQSVKNIARPVRVYAFSAAAVARLPPVTVPPPPKQTRRHARPRRQSAPRLSIVVLPFANLSHDPEQEYF